MYLLPSFETFRLATPQIFYSPPQLLILLLLHLVSTSAAGPFASPFHFLSLEVRWRGNWKDWARARLMVLVPESWRPVQNSSMRFCKIFSNLAWSKRRFQDYGKYPTWFWYQGKLIYRSSMTIDLLPWQPTIWKLRGHMLLWHLNFFFYHPMLILNFFHIFNELYILRVNKFYMLSFV